MLTLIEKFRYKIFMYERRLLNAVYCLFEIRMTWLHSKISNWKKDTELNYCNQCENQHTVTLLYSFQYEQIVNIYADLVILVNVICHTLLNNKSHFQIVLKWCRLWLAQSRNRCSWYHYEGQQLMMICFKSSFLSFF